jgi:hypothetical protein
MEAFRLAWKSELTISPFGRPSLYAFAQTKRTTQAASNVIKKVLEGTTQKLTNRAQPIPFSSIGLLA